MCIYFTARLIMYREKINKCIMIRDIFYYNKRIYISDNDRCKWKDVIKKKEGKTKKLGRTFHWKCY